MSRLIPRAKFHFPWEIYNGLLGIDVDRFIASTADGEVVMDDISVRVGFGFVVFTFIWELT